MELTYIRQTFTLFNIFRHDKNVTIDAVKNAVKKECNGPGQLLGYRALQLKIR